MNHLPLLKFQHSHYLSAIINNSNDLDEQMVQKFWHRRMVSAAHVEGGRWAQRMSLCSGRGQAGFTSPLSYCLLCKLVRSWLKVAGPLGAPSPHWVITVPSARVVLSVKWVHIPKHQQHCLHNVNTPFSLKCFVSRPFSELQLSEDRMCKIQKDQMR